ncbi:MAG: Recombinase [Candidatus Yanofskybacteria bacterium GW2011_GWA2_44_9]|uniref:Recombinase n=2 Tax=Candidatus Yanofskyibacteriota TaxID=1752733 RepID=A0A0G1MPI3_9BACT|nr:MAG: Recombinase [Candidatus Yanofskybacteria bacterium GW2011_GWA2_44_9]
MRHPLGMNNIPKQEISGAFEGPKAVEPKKIKYCLYARKSTESEEQQVLSIDSQIKEMIKIAERDGLEITEIRKESHSAKAVGQREIFNTLLTDIRAGKFTGILTWAPDRLSRNAGDLGSLVDLMDQKLLLEIRTFSQKFTNNPSEKFMLMILCSTAKLENDNKSENVKRGLRTRCEQGLRLSVAPTGYLNEKRKDKPCEVIVDPVRAPIIKQMFEKVANEHWSGRRIYQWLKNDVDLKTVNGKHLSLSNIFILLQKTFYYGVFEFPEGSGNWYTGQHTPIITKELFDRAREQLKRSEIKNNKEFAFTKLITCGLCESGITATEKWKYQKNGNTHRYVYCGCTKRRDVNCQCGYIKEEEIIEQIIAILDTLDMNELGIKQKFQDEIARYNKFRKIALGKSREQNTDLEIFDAKAYAIYILTEGAITEKRELLSNLKSKLMLKNRVISLMPETTA